MKILRNHISEAHSSLKKWIKKPQKKLIKESAGEREYFDQRVDEEGRWAELGKGGVMGEGMGEMEG